MPNPVINKVRVGGQEYNLSALNVVDSLREIENTPIEDLTEFDVPSAKVVKELDKKVTDDADKVSKDIEKINNDLTESLKEYCKVKNGKLYAFNSETQQFDKEIYTNTMPSFTEENIKFEFDSKHLTYTTTKDCILYGVLLPQASGSMGEVKINGVKHTVIGYRGNNGVTTDRVLNIALKKDDTVTLPSVGILWGDGTNIRSFCYILD